MAVACVVVLGVCLGFQEPRSAAFAPQPFSSYDLQAKALVAQMTLDEKVGQEFIKDTSDIEHYFFGSILSGGSSDPKEGNSLEAWTNLYDRLQGHTSLTRLEIPILYGIDAVHGHNNVLGAVMAQVAKHAGAAG